MEELPVEFNVERRQWGEWFRSRREDRQAARKVFREAVKLLDVGPLELAKRLQAGDEEAKQAILSVGEAHPEWDFDGSFLKIILELILKFLPIILLLF